MLRRKHIAEKTLMFYSYTLRMHKVRELLQQKLRQRSAKEVLSDVELAVKIAPFVNSLKHLQSLLYAATKYDARTTRDAVEYVQPIVRMWLRSLWQQAFPDEAVIIEAANSAAHLLSTEFIAPSSSATAAPTVTVQGLADIVCYEGRSSTTALSPDRTAGAKCALPF
jgi:hypothetical protein